MQGRFWRIRMLALDASVLLKRDTIAEIVERGIDDFRLLAAMEGCALEAIRRLMKPVY